jgi:hypothetical protein
MRAAREFGWQCFAVWSERPTMQADAVSRAVSPNGASHIA